jgi:hypothetical protein
VDFADLDQPIAPSLLCSINFLFRNGSLIGLIGAGCGEGKEKENRCERSDLYALLPEHGNIRFHGTTPKACQIVTSYRVDADFLAGRLKEAYVREYAAKFDTWKTIAEDDWHTVETA